MIFPPPFPETFCKLLPAILLLEAWVPEPIAGLVFALVHIHGGKLQPYCPLAQGGN
jgi:hypothetical protein